MHLRQIISLLPLHLTMTEADSGVVKVLVLGSSMSGKTWLIDRLIRSDEMETGPHRPTIEKCSSIIVKYHTGLSVIMHMKITSLIRAGLDSRFNAFFNRGSSAFVLKKQCFILL